MISQLDDLQGLAHSGQQLSRAALWPAEVQFEGSEEVLPATGGSLRQNPNAFFPGGPVDDFDLGFRVLKTLLGGVLPEVGTKLRWRRAGETAWRGWMRIDQASDPAGNVTFILQGGSVNK